MLIPTPFYREPAAKGCFFGCIYNLRAKCFPLFYRAGSSLPFPAMLCPAQASLTLALPDKLLTQDGRLTLSCWLNLIATTKLPFCRVNAVKGQLSFRGVQSIITAAIFPWRYLCLCLCICLCICPATPRQASRSPRRNQGLLFRLLSLPQGGICRLCP